MRRFIPVFMLTFILNVVAQNTPPVLSNFRVDNNQPSRIYFDSSLPISGTSTTGFTVSGKTISGVNVSSNSTSGHYFIISSQFNFWDNNTIRYEGGSNIKSNEGVSLNEMTLTYIENRISEPSGNGNIFYVSTNGNDKNDGLSEGSAWRTISFAASKAKAGDIVYIKTGNYGSENVVVKQNGTLQNPIKFIGYRTTPNDIRMKEVNLGGDSNDYGEMPFIKGVDRSTGTGIDTQNLSYIIIKNIIIENYLTGLDGSGGSRQSIENLLVRTIGLIDEDGGYGIRFKNQDDSNNFNKVKGCSVINATFDGIMVYGNHNLVENCSVFSNETKGSKVGTDYYIIFRGMNNIIRKTYVNRSPQVGHEGHGIGTKSANPNNSEYNLISNCYSKDFKGESFFFAYNGATKNVVENCVSVGSYNDNSQNLHFKVRDGASYNLFKNCIGYNGGAGISIEETVERDNNSLAHHNIWRNCYFYNNFNGIRITTSYTTSDIFNDNRIENCTFYNNGSFIRNNATGRNNLIINTSVNLTPNHLGYQTNKSGWEENFNHYYKSFTPPNGVGNITGDPKFENPSQNNFRLRSDSPLIDKGNKIDGLGHDFEGKPRPSGNGMDIGAFEYQDKTISSIKVDAGKDQTICVGSSATLTASGGSVYKWSTGATTKSITVSPKSTTTYSVTVSEGASSGIDEVIVTVNALPSANAGADVSIEAGQSAILTASGGDTYLWSTGETTASISVKPASSMIYEVKVTKNGCESSDSVKVIVNNTSTGSGIAADAGKDVSICSGSNAVLTASGGSVYTWSNGSSGNTIVVSPDKTTIYTVTVSDGVNAATDDVTVTVEALPVANAGADVSINAGQSTTLTASGGDTYLWSTGETTESITVKPDSITNYLVTVTSGGCSSKDTVSVSVNGSAPPASNIVADAGQDIIICKGNSAVLTASGGTSYIWSKGEKTKSIVVSPEKTTTYSVTVINGSNSNTADVTVYVTDLPVASAGNDVTIEAGQSAVLTAGGGDQYTWSTGETTKEITVNPLVTTTYEVIVGKNGCESTDKVQVTVKEAPPAAANAGSDITICKGESISLKSDGGATYSWSTGANTPDITVSPTRTTTYTLTANRGGTTSTDEVIVTVINCDLNNGVNSSVSNTTGSSDATSRVEQDDEQILDKADFELTVYPNPTEGKINVQTTVPIYNFNLVLMNINGNVIYADEMDANEDGINKEIDLSKFAKGVYLLQLYNTEESYVKKIMVI